MVNLHITLTEFRNESRVLKETASLVRDGLVDRVYIVAREGTGLPEHHQVDHHRSVWRLQLRNRNWPRSLLFQLLKYLEFCVRVLWYGRSKQATVVTIHSLALLPLGVLCKWICRARLVYDCHELETETYGLTGLRQRLARIVERRLVHRADLVMVVSGGISQWYRREYGLSNLVTVLNCPEYRAPERTNRLREALGIPADRRIVLYQGGLTEGRGIEQLLAAFTQRDDGRHVLVCMGYGALEGLVVERAESHPNIFYLPAVPPDVVLSYTGSADIGVSYIANPSLNDKYCLPNKLFEYIMAGLPVIVNDAPEMRRLVNRMEIGVVLEELTSESLFPVLEEIEGRDPVVLARNLQRTAKEYCWESQAAVMLAAYRKYVAG